MKNCYLLTLLITIFLSSCTSVEDRVENVLKNFSSKLNEIKNPEKISPYELGNKINQALQKLNNEKQKELIELTDLKDKELFESLFNIESIETYANLREILTTKNLEILKKIKGKFWIDKETSHPKSIFKMDENSLSFLNLKNKFPYKISNGNIICDNQNIYFDLNEKSLFIYNYKGEKKEFIEAKRADIIITKWKNQNTTLSGIELKKGGKGISFGNNFGKWKYLTYKLSGKIINTSRKYLVWGNIDVDKYKYTYLNENVIKHEYGAIYYRLKSKGPNNLDYIFSTDYNNPNKKTTKIEYTNNTTNNMSSSKSQNWDKVLNKYDDYTDEYIKYYNKAKNGDMSALQEYPKLMQKAEELQKSLAKAQNDNSLTSKQINRMTKIQTKMLNAIK